MGWGGFVRGLGTTDQLSQVLPLGCVAGEDDTLDAVVPGPPGSGRQPPRTRQRQETSPRPTPHAPVLRRPLLAEALPETASGPPRVGLGTQARKGVKTDTPALQNSLGLSHVTRNGLREEDKFEHRPPFSTGVHPPLKVKTIKGPGCVSGLGVCLWFRP